MQSLNQHIEVRPFEPGDQDASKALILGGLREHFGALDPTLNPDLDDIWTHYAIPGALFLVATLDEHLVGTGALVREQEHTSRIVRVSVDPGLRRRGIGRTIVNRLVDAARLRGDTLLLVETNEDWQEAIQLYRRCGFVPTAQRHGELHMALQLTQAAKGSGEPRHIDP